MKRRLTCAVLALCLLLSGCAATGTTSPQRYSVTWWDVFDTVTVISGYADSEADWNTQMTALHADLLRYNQLYDIYNHYDGMTNLADVNAGAAAAPVAVGDEIMNLLTFAQEMYQATDGACNAAAGAALLARCPHRRGRWSRGKRRYPAQNRRPAGCGCPLQYG